MPCASVRLPNGAIAIVCGPRQRTKRCGCGSGKPANLLCDWKVKGATGATCDAPLCQHCTHASAPGKDLCPTHARRWRARNDDAAEVAS